MFTVLKHFCNSTRNIWISWTEISKNAFKNGTIQSSICLFLFCFFTFHIQFYWFILFPKLTWSLWNHSFTFLPSRQPQQCLQESSMAAEQRAQTLKRFRIHTAIEKWDVPVRLLSFCFIWFCWNLCFIEQRGNKDEWHRARWREIQQQMSLVFPFPTRKVHHMTSSSHDCTSLTTDCLRFATICCQRSRFTERVG